MAIVYIHRKLDNNEVFYVGISKNKRRAFETFTKSSKRRNAVWKRITDKHGVKVEISHENICWEEACSIEKYLIDFWRSQGLFLANLTDGGEGVQGLKLNAEQIKTRSLHLNSECIRIKQKESMSRPDVLKKQSEIQKKVYSNPDLRKKQSEIQKKIHGTPEKRLQHKIISTNVFLREGYRDNIKEKVKLAMNRPDVLKKFNRRVYQYELNGNLLKEWDSIKSIKNELGFCKTYIINCCKNRIENYKNYKWQYVCERYS
jgi:hypothetical protein